MKILIIDYYYENYLSSIYKNKSDLELNSIIELKESKNFSSAYFYKRAFENLGHEIIVFPLNDLVHHIQWLKDNSKFRLKRSVINTIKNLPYLGYKARMKFHREIVEEAIKVIKPDIVYILPIAAAGDDLASFAKEYSKLVIGQIASRLPIDRTYKGYDFIMSSLPSFVEFFKLKGIESHYVKLAFDESILEKNKSSKRDIPLSFVGSFFSTHSEENQMLEDVSNQVQIDFWGHNTEILGKNSNILKTYHGEAWGNDMFKILGRSIVTINRHPKSFAGDYANNMRLYEATGMGAMLLTDKKKNIFDLFYEDEIVVYENENDLVEKVKYYIENPREAEIIAKRGQIKTLREHTYINRVEEILKLIEGKLK